MPLLSGNSSEGKRREIKAWFVHCYKRYESLFSLISDETAFYQKADPLRHPLIFYYGHTAVFFINKLKIAGLIDARIDPELESIFAVGVDEMSWDDLDEAHYDWPRRANTQAYRDKVYQVICDLIDTLPLELPITWESPWWVVLMGIEHENIHLETSAVLIRQLPLACIAPSPLWKECEVTGTAPQNSLLDVKGGKVYAGKQHKDDEVYGWDNEYGFHEAAIPDFKASKYLVSNGEFMEFVIAGGYENSSFWTEEGNAWRLYETAKMPRFWRRENDTYRLRTLQCEIPLPLDWPVEVNCLEAEAFCRWKSEQTGTTLQLPTEDEYLRLRATCYADKEQTTPAAIDLQSYASCVPVSMFRHGDFYDVAGNVWQWTRTPIYPYEGFKVHPLYDDFTVPTFDGKHNLIKGGSWISCGNLSLLQSRYAFRRHFYQFAGFRYVQSSHEEKIETTAYTTDHMISQYCHFGWGENILGVENYPARCAALALEAMQGKPKKRALDVGCAMGRSSFELARGFEEVVGVDFSARSIRYAQMLKEHKTVHYTMPTEGELESFHEANLSMYGLETCAKNVSFWQADACNLKPIFKGFDLIFAGNLIDRLYDPAKFLESLSQRLNEGGVLILTSPYTWQETSTPKEKWIGGYKKDGENFTTLEGLLAILREDFTLVETKDVPFVIRETARKHQHTISQMSIWQKK